MACTAAGPAFAAAAESGGELGAENDIVSIRIDATDNAVYGSPFAVTISADPADTQFIAVVLGTKGQAQGFVTLLLPEKVRILLELIPLPGSMSADPARAGDFNLYLYLKQLIDGNDVSVLLRVADELADLMDVFGYYLTSLRNFVSVMLTVLALIRRYLPEDLFTEIYLDEQPTDAGSYIAGAVTLDSGDINTGGLAFFRIAPKSEGVRQYWAQQTPATMTVAEAQSFNFAAVAEDNGSIVENPSVTYIYKTKGGTFGIGSETLSGPPTEPGEYTQTAKLGGNYAADDISRSFTIVE